MSARPFGEKRSESSVGDDRVALDVVEGVAGRLVRMAEGQSVMFKLTKKADDLDDIGRLPAWIRATLMNPPAVRG